MVRFFHPRPDPRFDWHPWFAWRPVKIRPGDGTAGPVVWLETIERKAYRADGYDGMWSFWFYRFSTKEPQG